MPRRLLSPPQGRETPERVPEGFSLALEAYQGQRRRRTDLERIAQEALAIERQQALEAGALGYMARFLVHATLPHKDPGKGVTIFERSNGDLRLRLLAEPETGLPWGKCPRLLLCWLSTEAVRTRSPHLELGASLSDFTRKLGLIPSGGRWGAMTRLRDQALRLFSCTVRYAYGGPGRRQERGGFLVASRLSTWWDPLRPEQPDLFGSFVELSPQFFRDIVEHPVPVDLRVLRVLRSPLALDIYCWLTYRASYLLQQTEIPWSALALQFGASYDNLKHFRAAFLKHAQAVIKLYPAARLSEGAIGLILSPTVPHIPKASPSRFK